MDAARYDVFEGVTTTAYFASPIFRDERIRHTFDIAFDHVVRHDEDGNQMAAETALLRLIAHLAVNLTSDGHGSAITTVSIRRVLDRINADPAARLSLTSLAADVGASRYQLIRAFARELGLTPHAYIVQQRLALARRLIRAGSAIADAAAASGFSDQSHLTRAFSYQFGVTPARYGTRAV